MSQGLGLSTILGCLAAGEKVVGLRPENWKAGYSANLGQHLFVDHQLGWRPGLKCFDAEALRSFATNIHSDVLAKMAEWKMRLDQLPDMGSDAIYMISQLREYMKWLVVGKRVERLWPEFVLDTGVTFYNLGTTNKLAVCVDVSGGDKVYMTRFDDLLSGLDLYQMIIALEKTLVTSFQNVYTSSVQVPCVHADLEPKLDWILGMKNGDYFIAYAQQKILFGMNELGFAVREETGMSMLKCAMRDPEPYLLSPNGESFLFWRRRPGVDFPISMFQFTRDDFRDPGDLNKIVE